MKRYLLPLFLIIMLSFSSCDEENIANDSIVGEWEMKSASNGMTGALTDYSPGNGSIMKFTDSSYEIISNWQLTRSGLYSIVKETSNLDNKIYNRVVYDNETNSIKSFFKVENNLLYIWTDGNDGTSVVYRRK
ncbi:hypothetical protein ACSX1A_11285 [Pontibacter sp. MBLB2868]|uniref:hypothetical protein n=1 Tax=Pontibacter sp. MBLB2868 TaxID=3451555 RepID=UPI003F74E310